MGDRTWLDDRRRPRVALIGAMVLVVMLLTACDPTDQPGDGEATVSWEAADGHGFPVIGYTITPAIDGVAQPASTFDSSATTQTVTGLTNGTTYTFRVTALTSCPGPCGIGTPSAPTPPLTVGAPTSPATVSSVRGGASGTADVTWAAPARDNGAPITGYTITPMAGSIPFPTQVVGPTTTSQTVTGLTNGVNYRFQVAAVNGRGTGPATSSRPVVIGRPAIGMAAGELFSCALLGDQTVQCWGANAAGQLGDGTTVGRTTPGATTDLTGVVAIESGWSHACAVLDDGTARCWGWNPYGQLGNGTISNVNPAPVPVPGLTGVSAITAGFAHTCALSDPGTVACWGDNSAGQLGDGTTEDRPSPVAVSGLTGVVAIDAGAWHTCAVLDTGTVRCWGRNAYGQLGDGGTANRSAPTSVSGLTGVVAVSGGWEHTCALLSTGAAMCWGANGSGQLGDGTTVTRLTPTPMSGVTSVEAIAAGGSHTCVLLADGGVSCTGGNGFGELGDGSNVQSLLVKPVPGIVGATQIVEGLHHACALLETGTERCWGYNAKGQIGDGVTGARWRPANVHGF